MSWPVVPLGIVADTALGKMLDSAKDRGRSRVPYLRNINVRWGQISTDEVLTMELDSEQRERFGVRAGDLLMCEGGEIGRCAIWPVHSTYMAYQKALHRIRTHEKLDAKFLRYVFEHYATTGFLAPFSTGSTIAHLPQQNLRTVPVPLPPLDEQRRIVEVLEAHLSRLDAADRGAEDAAHRLGRLRESTLAAAIRSAMAEPDTKMVELGGLGKVTTGVTPLRSNALFYEDGHIPWVTSGDLHQGVVKDISQYVTEFALEKTSLRMVPAGALLIAMYGEGRTRGTVAELGVAATTNQACAAVVLHKSELTPWVRLVLEANYGAMRRLAAGGVQPNLNLSLVRSLRVPIASRGVRRALINSMADVDTACARLNDQILQIKSRSRRLRSALLASAFSGGLIRDATTN